MITCHLTKLETALDSVRKAHPKLKPADSALVASALTLAGRHALALYDGAQHGWPEDYSALTKAMSSHLEAVTAALAVDAPKRTKNSPEEEAVGITVGLTPNHAAGEKLLEGRDDLKALLSDILQEGVEYLYAPSDIGWQWALDRANWGTVSNGDITRRIKVKASFTEGAVGVEMGVGGVKKRTRKKKEG